MPRPQILSAELMERLRREPFLRANATASWPSIEQIERTHRQDYELVVYKQLANSLATEFVAALMRKDLFEVKNTHDGLSITLEGYAFNRDQVVKLIEDAYKLGQADALRSRPNLEFPK